MSQKLTEQIQKQLELIESEERIRILFACESGSRAWGFPSPDSDYDVRFIYLHPEDWYLTLHEGRDVIEKSLAGDLDIGGWDFRKALRLMLKSNAIPWEWLQSPVVYTETPGFREALLKAAKPYYSMRSALHHYLSLAKRVVDETSTDHNLIKAKKYFYILRPLLAAVWVSDLKTIPPMEFKSLRQTQRLSEVLQTEIDQLLELKTRSNEKAEIARSKHLDLFIESTLAECETLATSLPSATATPDQLDEFFRQQLKGTFRDAYP